MQDQVPLDSRRSARHISYCSLGSFWKPNSGDIKPLLLLRHSFRYTGSLNPVCFQKVGR